MNARFADGEKPANWSISCLLQQLEARGDHPAIISWTNEGRQVETSAGLAAKARSLVQGFAGCGVEPRAVVGLHAPNGTHWIATALAGLSMGSVLMPLDWQAPAEEVVERLMECQCRLLVTTMARWRDIEPKLRHCSVTAFFLDESPGGLARSAQGAEIATDQAVPDMPPVPADTAVRFVTSGTTGKPKAFLLTHANLAMNIAALAELGIVDKTDRVLLPLPLYHAYAFVVGMLAGLATGATLVFPKAITGPEILAALRVDRITTIVGVPRLYESLVAGLERRVDDLSMAARFIFRLLTRLLGAAHRLRGLGIGRLLFAPLRQKLAPELRILISGGARLDPECQAKLEAWGWMVLVGYGLAETASVFTCNRPESRRIGSVGTPLAGGEVRIDTPGSDHVGEVLLRGPQITKGYLDNPGANAEAFTKDGWFRTGDLGRLEPDGSLTITGRGKEMIVLGGGKNLNPEELEKRYLHRPEIEELAVLEHDGSLVAVIRPNVSAVRNMGATNLRNGIRVVLAEEGQGLDSHERLTAFRLTSEPLPKTRLGKYQRFKLPEIYRSLGETLGSAEEVQLTAADRVLLEDPLAAALWRFFRERFPDKATGLNVHPHLDLNLDSFGWMQISIEIEERLGLPLSESNIAEAESLGALIRTCLAEAREAKDTPPAEEPVGFSMEVDYWLRSTGALYTLMGLCLYVLNWLAMRLMFRLRVEGLGRLPRRPPYIIAPNHVSDLDALAIAATLSPGHLNNTYWAGDIKRLFHSRITRVICRIAHIFPVGEKRPMYAVEAAIKVLRSGKAQGWFPEGWRSPDGRLQSFMPGIGIIMRETEVPAVPTYVAGAYEALPRGRYLPSFKRITVVFGEPAVHTDLEREGRGESVDERIADGLRRRVIALGRPFDIVID
jgi:long-chain acyl-CoA synthetase